MNMQVRQCDCFSTEYANEKMTWKIYCIDNETAKGKDWVYIGEEGEVSSDKIKDSILIVCEPCEGVSQWCKWRNNLADKLENNGVRKQDIKQAIVGILFDGVNKYKDSIKDDLDNPLDATIQKKRKFYFLAQFEDSL